MTEPHPAREYYDKHDTITGEEIMTGGEEIMVGPTEDFPDHNLDVLHERTASGRGRHADAARPVDLQTDPGAVVAELESLKESINTVTIASVPQFHGWLMQEIDRRIAAHGGDPS